YLLIIIKYKIMNVMKIFTNNRILSIDIFLSSNVLNKSLISLDSIAVRNSFGENLLSKSKGLILSADRSVVRIYLFPLLSRKMWSGLISIFSVSIFLIFFMLNVLSLL